MEYAPLPPNCPHIAIIDGDPCLMVGGRAVTKHRPLVAPVARCAWMDLALSICGYLPPDERHHNFELWKEYSLNAESWRLWGLS